MCICINTYAYKNIHTYTREREKEQMWENVNNWRI